MCGLGKNTTMIKLTQWVSKTETKPILINPAFVQAIQVHIMTDGIPIIGDDRAKHSLTHIIYAPGTHGVYVTESFETVRNLFND
jgi:hypothetical protein